jgi:hypothetical protein
MENTGTGLERVFGMQEFMLQEFVQRLGILTSLAHSERLNNTGS